MRQACCWALKQQSGCVKLTFFGFDVSQSVAPRFESYASLYQFDFSVRLAASGMIFAHWLYLAAAIFDLGMPRGPCAKDNVKEPPDVIRV